MTSRDILVGIVKNVFDIDRKIPLLLLYRDSHGSVEKEEEIGIGQIVNGKFYLEAGSIIRKD